MIKYILAMLVIFLVSGCKKEEEHPLGPRSIPSPVFFLIKKNGQRLSETVLNRTDLYYYKDNKKNYVPDFARGVDGFDTLGIMATLQIGILSGQDHIKEYYLDYYDGDIDTLFVNHHYLSQEEALKHPCFCHFPLVDLKFNGKNPPADSSIKVQKVYLFQKP
jgi:hypothetical protein